MKFFGGLLGLLIFVGLIFGTFLITKTDFYDLKTQDTSYFFEELGQKWAIMNYNMGTNFHGGPRKRAGSQTMRIEDDLRMMSKSFQGFTKRDWAKFWKFIYGPKKSKFFEMKRWRTKREMERFFAKKFPNPFSQFAPNHWKRFWNLIAEDKGFKHVVYSDSVSAEDKALLKSKQAVLIKVPGSVRINYNYSDYDRKGGL